MPNKKNKTNDGYMNNSINDTKFQFYGNHRMLLSPPSSPMPPFRHYMPVFTSNFQSPSFQHLSPIPNQRNILRDASMPKYYCDYCDTYLTHDSPSVRKTHCQGRKHKDNVKYFYQKWMEEQAQHLIDATTAAFKAGKIASNPFAANKGAAIPPPPNLGSNLGSRSGVPPQGPPGMMPPPGMHPAGPMGPGGPMMMGPHGPMPPPMMGMRPPMMGPMGPMGPMMGPIGPMGHMRPPMNGPPPPMVGPPPMKK